MRMRRNFWRLLAVVFLVASTTFMSHAATRTVGVSIGNSFEHSATFSWNSTDPNATMPSYYKTSNETEGSTLLIANVSGTTVTLNSTLHFKNGTDSTQVGTIDIDTGDGNMIYWLVAADLGVNDSVYAGSNFSARRINETMTRSYPNGSRSVNHLNVSTESNITGSYLYMSQNVYWDKSTGVMVEMELLLISQTNVSRETMSGTVAMTESNVWVVPEFPAFTSVLVVLVLPTTIIISGKKRLLKTR